VRRVLLISPHFPPDSSAGAHRVRLLAPHLPPYGWEPTVLTCRADAYEGKLDGVLPQWVPASLRVVRSPALPARVTRRFGIGDLGLRSFAGLFRTASDLLEKEAFDALFITIFPAYTALIGPLLVRRFGVPFVLDYQDPWVSAWGTSVGGGRNGTADLKSRASRRLAEWLEPHAVRAASAITAVSPGTYEPILQRNPGIRPITEAIPIGAEPGDFRHALTATERLPFDPGDGLAHVCSTGTILPLGFETLRAVLDAVRLVRDRRPDLYSRLRLHFLGTSNQTVHSDEMRVMPLARDAGVEDVVQEVPTRLAYSTVVEVQKAAAALLALGSSEHHYTASKIFPLLLSRRPVLAVYHEKSTVTDILGAIGRPPSVNVVTYSDTERAAARVEAVFERLVAIVERPEWREQDVDASRFSQFFAENLAGRLAGVLDRIVARSAA
jgi:hypothetical protein